MTANTPAPADFDGYLALLLPAGQAPGIYRLDRIRVGRDTPTACEDCGAMQTRRHDLPFYRWTELADVNWPLHLGICHSCLADVYWAKRHTDDEAPNGDGDRMHIYSPIDPVERARRARS